jgi:hypothetical protein
MKLSGLIMAPGGSFSHTEFKGPPDYDHWLACFKIFMSAMIMLGACAPPYLLAYAALIGHYAKRYGQACWALLYQAETRFRREVMERMRRRESALLDDAISEGGRTQFEPQRPCNLIFKLAVTESQYWHLNVEEPSLLIVAGARKAGAFMGADSPICDSGVHLATSGTPGFALVADRGNSSSSRGDGGRPQQQPPAKRQHVAPAPPQRSDKEVRHAPYSSTSTMSIVANGRYTANRGGNALCIPFQSGSCDSSKSIQCPRDAQKRHLCNNCLSSTHGSEHPARCTASAPSNDRMYKPNKRNHGQTKK